jgi:putative alpha-1,2-mannosidase
VAGDTAESMVDDYAQDGMLPKWMEDNGETYVIVGDPADAIIADYYAFGGTNFSTSQALTDLITEASKASNVRPGLNYLSTPGYLPGDGSYGCCNYYGPVSTTLEYDTADFALSAFAGALGDTADQATFADRAQDWRNVLDPDSGFDQPRDANGTWPTGFDPTSGNDFVEADSWIYTGMVPSDVAGLASAKGGDTAMAAYLGTVLRSFTGANGYAWMGNEHVPDDTRHGDARARVPMFTQAQITLPSGNTLTRRPAVDGRAGRNAAGRRRLHVPPRAAARPTGR